MGLGKILGLFGLYKVNDAYMKPVNKKLGEIEGDLSGIAEVADSASQIIDALKAGDTAKAVIVALEFCEVNDETKQMKELQEKLKAGEKVDDALPDADGPALGREIAEATMREVAEHYEKVTGLIPAIAAAGEEAAKKLTDLPSAAASWSLAEKIGTPEAVQKTVKKAKKVKDAAADAKAKLEALKESIEGLNS